MPNSNSSQDIRFMLPETIWLEPEHFLVAQQISYPGKTDPGTSWQAYLNTLALIGFEIWLQKRLPDKVITKDTSMVKAAGSLKVDEFKFCAIATQNLLSEMVSIPSLVVDKPEYSAHFYVVLEILEEEEQAIIRGFLPHNQLVEIIYNSKLPASEGYYHIPLNLFDIEPNHLLFYQHYIKASEFARSLVDMDSQVNQSSQNLSNVVSTTTTKLSHWLQGVFEES
ncbi:MAG: DUF1822 family protein, partial [Cyanobacteria bacterium J06649_11]